MKVCFNCKEEKQESDFNKDKQKKDGLRHQCRDCNAKRRRELYTQLTEKQRDRNNERQREFRRKDPEKFKAREMMLRKKNPERYLERRRQYSSQNRDRVVMLQRQYWERNREKILEAKKKRYHNNPRSRVSQLLRNRIYEAIISQDATKHTNTMKLLGCSMDEFLTHISSRFTEGMGWDNYGKWHLDHVMPCVSFDLTKEEEQKKCFHYTNLQPLWAKDNLSKGSKIL